MVEPIFKAPLPPTQENSVSEVPQEIQHPEIQAGNGDIKEKLLPYLWYVLGGTFFLGLIFGVMIAPTQEEPVVSQSRFPLISVENPDIQKPLPLCGQTDPSKECVLFLMNEETYDKAAKDLFARAAAKMGRQKYLIEIDNTVYANRLIPPGHFAQIKIPERR